MGLIPYTILIILSIIALYTTLWGSFEGAILSHKSLLKIVQQKAAFYNLAAVERLPAAPAFKKPGDPSEGEHAARKHHPLKGKISLPALFREQNSIEGKGFCQRLLKQIYAPLLTEDEIKEIDPLVESFLQLDWKKGNIQWKDLCPKEERLMALFYILLKGSCLDPMIHPLKAPSLDRLFSLKSSPFFFSLSDVDYLILEVYFENRSKVEKIKQWEESNQKLVTRQDLYQIMGQDPSLHVKISKLATHHPFR